MNISSLAVFRGGLVNFGILSLLAVTQIAQAHGTGSTSISVIAPLGSTSSATITIGQTRILSNHVPMMQPQVVQAPVIYIPAPPPQIQQNQIIQHSSQPVIAVVPPITPVVPSAQVQVNATRHQIAPVFAAPQATRIWEEGHWVMDGYQQIWVPGRWVSVTPSNYRSSERHNRHEHHHHHDHDRYDSRNAYYR